MKYLLILLILLLFISCTKIQVTRVKLVRDGDTFYTKDHKAIRLAEIDCPELDQPYGQEAKDYLSSLIYNKQITLKKVNTDKYGRLICEVYVNGEWINRLMVINGLAWAYRDYSSLYEEELTIRKNHIGLWSENNPTPPFKWRNNGKRN